MPSIVNVELRKMVIGQYTIFPIAVYLDLTTQDDLTSYEVMRASYALTGLTCSGSATLQDQYILNDIVDIDVTDGNLRLQQTISTNTSYNWRNNILTARYNGKHFLTSPSTFYTVPRPRKEFCPAFMMIDNSNGNVLTGYGWSNPLFTNEFHDITIISNNGIATYLIERDISIVGYDRSLGTTFYGAGATVDDISEKARLNPDPYEGGGYSDISEMTGDFDGTSDPIDFPALPTLGAVDSGFITLFNPDLSELQALARYMWTNPLFDISAWKKVFADPMDAILGLSIVPVAVPDSVARPIIVGNIVTDVSMKVATTQFVEVQCGSLNVNEFWSAYLDYEPYTKAEIYLPFCGVHQISVDDIMNKTVEVRYHIDILSGACCAFVKCGDSVLYQFIGQCSSSIPISGNDFTNVINGVLSATTAIGSLVATGGASAPLAVPSLSATALNALKPNIEKSGAMGGTGGMLAIQKPYLVLTRPKQALPESQNHFTGYPSFITENLGDLSGYTEIEKIHLEGVPATDAELSEIETLLKGGVIL